MLFPTADHSFSADKIRGVYQKNKDKKNNLLKAIYYYYYYYFILTADSHDTVELE